MTSGKTSQTSNHTRKNGEDKNKKRNECRTVYHWMKKTSVFMESGIGQVEREQFKEDGPWEIWGGLFKIFLKW